MTRTLDVQNLTVDFRQDGETTHAVRGVSFHVDKGETVALVGESGSGKSVSALSTVQLLGDSATIGGAITIQAQILDLLADLKEDLGMSMLFITHDLTIVRKIADRVYVMKDGEIVEHGPTAELFANPQHPYTRTLLEAESTGVPIPVDPAAKVVAKAKNLKIWFPLTAGLLRRTTGYVKAVNDATFEVRAGETIGIVGESGSGKTTLALAMMRLIRSEGRIVFMGNELQGLREGQMRPLRSDMQIVFQDPYGSLSPRMTVEQIIAEGLTVHGTAMNLRPPWT